MSLTPRRRWRFTLQTLFALVTAACVAIGCAAGEEVVATIVAIFALAVLEGPLSKDTI